MQNYDTGNRIYELRKAKGLSQKELGALIGVSNKAVSKWETGAAAPKTETIIKLASVLGVSSEELLCGKKPEIENYTTLDALSDKTANIFLKKELSTYKQNSEAKEIKNARIYLISTAVLFIAITVILLILMSLGEALNPFFDVYIDNSISLIEIILSSFAMAYAICGVYTGFIIFAQAVKKCPVRVIILMCLLFYITFIIIELAGLIMLIPQIIKSIRILNNKKENNDG